MFINLKIATTADVECRRLSSVTPEVRARVGLWKAQVEAACLAGHIGKGDDKYAHALLAIPSIARGDFALHSDAAMGRWINVSGRTIRRHRKALADQGLIEVLGHGKDHRPCMVRPVLRDGSPVFQVSVKHAAEQQSGAVPATSEEGPCSPI
jgi:hypothetical protein